jgi:CxxC motif-containing protein (DUF1111 family)
MTTTETRPTLRLMAAILLAAAIPGAVAVAAARHSRAGKAEAARIAAVTRPTTDFSKPEAYELRPGGAATVFKAITRDIFSYASANMSFERELDFKVGNGIFRKAWVSAPSSTTASDGLGPIFNARACQDCHLKDGRGTVPAAGETAVSMFLRLSIPPQTEADRQALATHRKAVIAEPTYGGQLQNFSIQGLFAEGRMVIDYAAQPVTLADGTVVTLRKPSYRVADLRYGPMHRKVMLSPRVAPPMLGMGLLEAIAEEDILKYADPTDADGDGISGRPNYVWSDKHGRVMLGRFGWKAGEPTVAQQAAGAFRGDIGISSPLYPKPYGDCTASQDACRKAPHGGASATDTVEATRKMFDLVVFYSRNLGVPARRGIGDPQVLHGKKLFYASGCIACHRPKYVTRRDPARPEQSFQLIWPYTDLLLHDMGEGLADGRPEGEANGREWRTPPLWGLGLATTVNPRATYLHDGRARTLLEAILWHGGEAAAAQAKVVGMTKAERDALIAFLKSL